MSRYDPKAGNRVPLARSELLEVSKKLREIGMIDVDRIADHVEDIVNQLLYRNRAKKAAARPKQAKITPALVRDVKVHLALFPHKHDRDIGQLFGIDGGRVSEISQGHRTEAYPQGTPRWKGSKP